MLNRISVRSRLLLVACLIMALFAEMSYFGEQNGRNAAEIGLRLSTERMLHDQKEKLQVASHTLAEALGEHIRGLNTQDERIAEIRRLIDGIRFEDDRSGYYYVYDGTTNVALPTNHSLQGTDLSDMTDVNGVPLVVDLNEAANQGGGFVQYVWDKPGHGPTAKLGYAELIPGTTMWLGAGVYLDNIDEQQAVIRAQLEQSLSSNAWSMRLISTLIFIAILATSLWVAWGLLRSIKVVTQSLHDIADGEGDLTKRIEIHSQDEFGELAGWFNRFMDKLHQVVSTIVNNVTRLDQEARSLSGVADDLASHAKNSNRRTNDVNSSTQEMSQNISRIASAVEQSRNNIATVATAAEEMTATIGSIAESTSEATDVSMRAVDQTKSTWQRIHHLGSRADAIDEVTEVITEISEQINLLSLNATIEAARSGEAGKGFAVVASEIKDLAKQTADATLDIREKITDVQTNTNNAVTDIEAITAVIENVNAIVASITAAVGEQSKAAQEIALNIGQAAHGMDEINQSINEVSTASTSISGDIAAVSESTGDLSGCSEKVDHSSDDLKEFSAQLLQTLSTFRV
ncbi:methyl-accepting chemotaxis protein [Crateriforma conspicua]|uniref:methyl-accepting chemotaxis protein n=1 Tax=Crateriforma conspicua TaxID=2527996 RepID=UPI00118A8D1E|nr:methyl-accepting chemotaxis protein [Crateriforma conspicua]QDV65462.1 Methyl-accepting chemotaxis protein 4 [Crateriforma conspicua]